MVSWIFASNCFLRDYLALVIVRVLEITTVYWHERFHDVGEVYSPSSNIRRWRLGILQSLVISIKAIYQSYEAEWQRHAGLVLAMCRQQSSQVLQRSYMAGPDSSADRRWDYRIFTCSGVCYIEVLCGQKYLIRENQTLFYKAEI